MHIDKKRAFTGKQQAALLLKAKRVCQLCKLPIEDGDKIEFNHNHPHSLGGPTDVTNGDVFHMNCNRKLGNSFPELADIKLRKWQKKAVATLILKIEMKGDLNAK